MSREILKKGGNRMISRFLSIYKLKTYHNMFLIGLLGFLSVLISPIAEAVTFLPSVQVNEDAGNLVNDLEPSIVVTNEGIIYIVWHDEVNESIFFSKSVDDGSTFSTAVRINDLSAAYPPSYKIYNSDIAIDANGNIYVVWHDYRDWADDSSWNSKIDIYMDKSVDGGQTWGTDVVVPNVSPGTYPWRFQPYIAVDKNNSYIYVIFTDYNRYHLGDEGDVCAARSIDGGISFEVPVKVDDTGGITTQTWSSIDVNPISGDVCVTFNDSRDGNKDIFFAKSSDYGVTYSTNVKVNDVSTNDQEESTIKIDSSGVIYVVWKDWRDDPSPSTSPYLNDIYIAKSIDGGSSFENSVKITDTYMDAEYSYVFPPRLAINEGIIHVVWHDTRSGSSTCFYDRSLDGGQTFSTDYIIHDDTQTVSHSVPRIDVDDYNRVYITWMDKRNGNNMFDVFFSRLLDTEPPYVSNINPLTGATSVAEDTNIIVNLCHDGMGIDQSSIVMTVDGITVVPMITGTHAEYILTYDPPQNFSYSQVVNVTIDAQDLNNPVNVMSQYSSSFTIRDYFFFNDLSQIKVYPNPYREGKTSFTIITFDSLPEMAVIKIYTLGGLLVKEIKVPDGGEVVWDIKNNDGKKIASGVYIYFITDKKGNKKSGKIAIIR